MKLKLTLAAAICAGAISASAAQAQMGPAFTDANNLQARATLTIPFGGDSKGSDAKPQLALGFRSESLRPNISDWALRPSAEVYEVREFKLALTIEDTPALLMNDQVLMIGDQLSAKEEDKASGGMDTYDKTVLTVIAGSLAVIVGVIAVTAS